MQPFDGADDEDMGVREEFFSRRHGSAEKRDTDSLPCIALT
jgi:hypothetical protein